MISTTALLLSVCATQLYSVQAFPSPAPVILGSTATYAVLAGTTVTNAGLSVLTGDLGISPSIALVGFPIGKVSGDIHLGDSFSLKAQSDLTIAINDAASRASDALISGDLGGLTLAPGVYKSDSTLAITGTLFLDAEHNPNAVWIFQMASSFSAEVSSQVIILNPVGTNAKVFWLVGSGAEIKTSAKFVGTILAGTGVAVGLGATINGRLLASTAAVTLLNNAVGQAAEAKYLLTKRFAKGLTGIHCENSNMISGDAYVIGACNPNEGITSGSFMISGCTTDALTKKINYVRTEYSDLHCTADAVNNVVVATNGCVKGKNDFSTQSCSTNPKLLFEQYDGALAQYNYGDNTCNHANARYYVWNAVGACDHGNKLKSCIGNVAVDVTYNGITCASNLRVGSHTHNYTAVGCAADSADFFMSKCTHVKVK